MGVVASEIASRPTWCLVQVVRDKVRRFGEYYERSYFNWQRHSAGSYVKNILLIYWRRDKRRS